MPRAIVEFGNYYRQKREVADTSSSESAVNLLSEQSVRYLEERAEVLVARGLVNLASAYIFDARLSRIALQPFTDEKLREHAYLYAGYEAYLEALRAPANPIIPGDSAENRRSVITEMLCERVGEEIAFSSVRIWTQQYLATQRLAIPEAPRKLVGEGFSPRRTLPRGWRVIK